MSLRKWIEASPKIRSSLLGFGTGLGLYALPRCGLEMSVMAAMMMPGVYLGYAWIYGQNFEVLQETATTAGLCGFNLLCLSKVALEQQPYFAPLAVAVHGLVDALHMWGLFPSSKHVHHCSSEYPLLCAYFDLGMAMVLTGCIWIFSA